MEQKFNKTLLLLGKRKVVIKACIECVLELRKIKSVDKLILEDSFERLEMNLRKTTVTEDKGSVTVCKTFLTLEEAFTFCSDCNNLQWSLKRLLTIIEENKELNKVFGSKGLVPLTKKLALNQRAFKYSLDRLLVAEGKASLDSVTALDQKRKTLNQGFVFRPMSWYSATCVLFIYLIIIDSLVTRFL